MRLLPGFLIVLISATSTLAELSSYTVVDISSIVNNCGESNFFLQGHNESLGALKNKNCLFLP
jgi:hypothetical protein